MRSSYLLAGLPVCCVGSAVSPRNQGSWLVNSILLSARVQVTASPWIFCSRDCTVSGLPLRPAPTLASGCCINIPVTLFAGTVCFQLGPRLITG